MTILLRLLLISLLAVFAAGMAGASGAAVPAHRMQVETGQQAGMGATDCHECMDGQMHGPSSTCASGCVSTETTSPGLQGLLRQVASAPRPRPDDRVLSGRSHRPEPNPPR